MKHHVFEFCPAEPGILLSSYIHSEGDPYYDYMLLYKDGLICVSDNAEILLMDMDTYFPLNTGSTNPPNIYPGGKVSNVF